MMTKGMRNKTDNKTELSEVRPESRDAARGAKEPGTLCLEHLMCCHYCQKHSKVVPDGDLPRSLSQVNQALRRERPQAGFLNMQFGN